MSTSVQWERLTAPELKALAARNALVVLPVAALEQHGPHLPVWTDSAIGHAMCIKAAEIATDVPAVVLPPMWLGLSEHHFPFGGTISVDYATFAGILRCMTRSIMASGFKRLFLVNSHGGNIDPLAVASRELAHEFGIPVATTSLPRVAAKEIAAILTTQPGIHHACEGETSLWLHLDPAQVRMDKIEGSASQGGNLGNPDVTRFWSFAERAPVTGVRGNPPAATAEKGAAIAAAIAEGLARAMRDEGLWTVPDPVWKPGRAQTNP